MRIALMLTFCTLAVFAFAPAAFGSTLYAGDILEIQFSTSSPVCPYGACDGLILYPQEQGAYFATDVTANLYDGTSLLGTYFSPSCCVPTFRSSNSLFQVGSATVDFAAIDSGTIYGIIDMSIANGYLRWPSSPTPQLVLGHATGPGGLHGGTGIDITSVEIISPEPSTITILLGGLVFLLVLIHRRPSVTSRSAGPDCH